MASGTTGKAPSTIKKQRSMWENHIQEEFGNRYVEDITLQELKNYLAQMYANGDGRGKEQSYSYKYVEGFLKFFYLLWACAYNDNYISTDLYTKMFLDRKSRLSMPEMTQEDNDDYKDIKTFTPLEIKKMNLVLQDTNFHVAFILGYMTGVRISECFGLMWSDVDWTNSTIQVKKQLVYEDSCFVLRPVKTLKSSRLIDMSEELHDYLFKYYQQQQENKKRLGIAYKNTERVIDRTSAKNGDRVITGGDFICRKKDGELMTVNTVKYWARVLAEIGIDFKYHSLRRTHATYMAAANTPAIELMNRLGHKKIETTMKYYINTNQLTKDKLKANLKLLTGSFADGTMAVSEERKKQLVDGGELQRQEFTLPNVPIPSPSTIEQEYDMESFMAEMHSKIKMLFEMDESEVEEELEEVFED